MGSAVCLEVAVRSSIVCLFFFFNDTATTEIYTLSLHDALPIFIALYWVLLAAIELRHAPFILWIKDLAALDPYYVLPILMTVTMVLQTRMNPVPPDPVQAKVMQFMPFAFSIFFFFFPAGLVLYWLVNNILSIAQQWQIQRMFNRDKPAHGKR